MLFTPKRAAGALALFGCLLAAGGVGAASTPAAPVHTSAKAAVKSPVALPAMIVINPSARPEPTRIPILPPCEGPILTWPIICFNIYG